MKSISIVGFGRFGKVLYKLLKDDFIITLYDKKPIQDKSALHAHTKVAHHVEDVYASETIFYAVPIGEFEHVIASHKKYMQPHHILMDVLSVKMHPATIFTKYVQGTHVQAMLTHPMFGPDSSQHGFEGLPIILDQFKASNTTYRFWKEYFQSKKLCVVEMPANTHDNMAAHSQGLAHFIGRLLKEYHLAATPIDSLGTKKLLELQEQTCNDTWQLFNDLQHYNPHTKEMRLKIGAAYDTLYNKLLPPHVHEGTTTFGIQGGKGSFNEEALKYYVQRAHIKNYTIKYLYTSARVMHALHRGEIDRGQMAIHNSSGGMVDESLHAMAKYKFKIVDEFAIKISHALMIRPDANFSGVTTVMTHPQVLAQCQKTLAQKYPRLHQTSGVGILIDHAVVAKKLGEKKLPTHTATMGSKLLAQLYGLTIVEDNLQDLKENYTTFLQVERL